MVAPVKFFIAEDSSFLISIIDINYLFHKKAISILSRLQKYNDKTLILLPEIVINESVITLIRKGINRTKVENSIHNLLHIENIRCFNITEGTLFRFCKNAIDTDFGKLKTSDFLIASTAKDFSAPILTFDVQMRKRVKPTYDEIYCCDKLKDLDDETELFFNNLEQKIS